MEIGILGLKQKKLERNKVLNYNMETEGYINTQASSTNKKPPLAWEKEQKAARPKFPISYTTAKYHYTNQFAIRGKASVHICHSCDLKARLCLVFAP